MAPIERGGEERERERGPLLGGLRRERERLRRLAEMRLDSAAVKCIDLLSFRSH